MGGSSSKKPKRLSNELVARISQYIRDGVLKPGDKLASEVELASAEGFSRSVVRDAILRLQSAGILETRRSVGTFVIDQPPTVDLSLAPQTISTFEEVIELLEFRMGLELVGAELAATNRDEHQLEEIRSALFSIKEKATITTGIPIQADFNFHLKIAKASGNTFLFDIMKHLGTKLIPRTKLNSAYAGVSEQAGYLADVYQEHELIYHAIEMKNPESARLAMFLHLRKSKYRLLHSHNLKQTSYL